MDLEFEYDEDYWDYDEEIGNEDNLELIEVKEGWRQIFNEAGEVEFIQDSEFIEYWYWLVYQGKNPEGYRKPDGILTENWKPEFNCWRDATKEEIAMIKDKFKTENFILIDKKTYTAIAKVSQERGFEDIDNQVSIEIPISIIYKLLPEGLIVKMWKSNR